MALFSTATTRMPNLGYDVEASRKAGVRIIALRCGGWNDHSLEGAEAIYDTPGDLLKHLGNTDLSPPGARVSLFAGRSIGQNKGT